ncbi:hypothetical protein NTE_02222 [Candidatus Nitrososphaera evergladensis SR1]|uniref:Carbonic anhydrase n=1 Tax=Candidatus Nitrososphaera evergladensis SR1 TaxID=1459636 RepID=A0A075MRZ1_9ARCH|nr:carbonic anhydrase [Candidatus Nitrososphaera evergladensis]AIF84276.1 hypothetical protein NTE_02222 [Candidatus Nitrososphaera evergladensis SR1]
MTGFRFGTAINCIDGRTQQVVIDYMKQSFGVDGVDMVTFPGADGMLSNWERSEDLALIKQATSISTERHGSKVIAVVGHHDCAGNPGNKEHHYAHIRRAVQEVHSWKFPVQIIGLYVNDKWKIEEVR